MRYRHSWLASALIAGVWISAGASAGPPADGPQLDPVPTAWQSGSLPEPATWPALRYERPLRLLVIADKHHSVAVYQRIARRMRSSLDVRYFGGGDARYHVNDKWIEPKENPTAEELGAYCRQVILDTLRPGDGMRRHDVVFCSHVGKDRDLDERLLAFASSGGVVVVTGSAYPADDSPLGGVWPAKPGPGNSWMSGGSQRTPQLELAGVPTERLTGHTWIPVPEPADGARALALGEAGAMFAQKVDQGTLLYVPTGPMSRRWDFFTTIQLEYDHDEIWLRAWDQVLYALVRGPEGTPVMADLRLKPAEQGPGGTMAFTLRVVRCRQTGPLVATLHVVSPRGEVVHQRDVPLDPALSGEQTLDLDVEVLEHWGGGLYSAYLTIGDPAAKQQLHQALELAPVAGSVQLQVMAGAPGYRVGQEARATVLANDRSAADAARRPAWSGEIRLGVYDFRGRLLHADSKPVSLAAKPAPVEFAWRVTDHGVRVDTYWVVAAAVREDVEFARARAKFYKYEPWSTRNEYQWSTWAGISCTNASTSPAAMRLMAHAGMNALGYPGRNGLSFPAERWGWRYYNEGLGMNTFSPLIEHDSDEALAAFLESKADLKSPDLRSAAFVLGSVGEEAGYKTGWGRTYYWDTPVADEKGCRAFQWYLQTRYPSLAALNAAWHTNYASWEDVKLTREFSGNPPPPGADGWARPKESPLGPGVEAVSLVPYSDTQHFYAWYYDRIIAATKRIFRENTNPVTRTMASAPSSWIFASRECDVAVSGPGAWNESQRHALDFSDDPAFALVWGHFDWPIKTENLFWGFLLQRTGHNNFWVDVPLMFNNDMTHTRASMAMRRWTHRLAGHERAVLDGRPAPSDVGVLPESGVSINLSPKNMHTSLRVALMQSGFHYETADLANLSKHKIVFAVARHGVSSEEAERLHAYVEGGGTLVFVSRFASQDEFGAPQPVSPGQGLADRWGLKVTAKTKSIPQYAPTAKSTFSLDGVDASLKGFVASGLDVFREDVRAGEWTTLASYAGEKADGTPAILTRTLGKGCLVYLNAIYQSHHYIQWVTPTGPERQGLFKLIEHLCSAAGAGRTLRLDGDLQQALHVAVTQFTDETREIRYVLARTSGEVPWTSSRLQWLGPGDAVYDVLNGTRLGRQIPLNFRPGQGRWLAVLRERVESLRIEIGPEPRPLRPGLPVRIDVQLLDADGRPVPGKFPLELKVANAEEDIAGLSRSFSLESGGSFLLQTAPGDPHGQWTFTVTDGITGSSGSATVEVAPRDGAQGPGFLPLGWPSEIDEPASMPSSEFLSRLGKLAELYRTDQGSAGWLAKQRLGAHYEFFPETRHSLLRPLYDVEWTRYVGDLRDAVRAGDTFVLAGEDIGVDPATGLATYPHLCASQLPAVAAALHDAQWRVGTRDGETLIAQLDRGQMILCRESVDAAGHTNADAARWQQRWLAELADAKNLPVITAPDATRLGLWWAGRVAATDAPRTVAWFGSNHRELELVVDPSRPLDGVFTFTVPPTGTVEEVDFTIRAEAEARVSLDVGCDSTVDAEVPLGTRPTSAHGLVDWPAVVSRYWKSRAEHGGPVRDENRWRVIPVRLRSNAATTVFLASPRLVLSSR